MNTQINKQAVSKLALKISALVLAAGFGVTVYSITAVNAATCFDSISCSEYNRCQEKAGDKCQTISLISFGSTNDQGAYGASEDFMCGQYYRSYATGVCNQPYGGCGGFVPKVAKGCPKQKSTE